MGASTAFILRLGGAVKKSKSSGRVSSGDATVRSRRKSRRVCKLRRAVEDPVYKQKEKKGENRGRGRGLWEERGRREAGLPF